MRNRNLLTQVLVANLLVIVAAVVAAALAANPSLNSLGDDPQVGLILAFAVGITVLVNVIMLQRRFRPLERLVEEMERADLSRPGANLRSSDGFSGTEEVERLNRAFRRMLERLEAERRRASSAALTAQEEERARLARDLHDEVNQSLTGLLLRLEAARSHAPMGLAQELGETKILANKAMQELLTLARQLRPTALDDLGLKAALSALVDELGRESSIATSFESSGEFGELPKDVQLVVYRVAQEAVSNAAQHADARHLRMRLERDDDRVGMVISDDGRGFTFADAARGLGIGGMRERALLVGGELNVESRPDIGTRVRLNVPITVSDGNSDTGAR